MIRSKNFRRWCGFKKASYTLSTALLVTSVSLSVAVAGNTNTTGQGMLLQAVDVSVLLEADSYRVKKAGQKYGGSIAKDTAINR